MTHNIEVSIQSSEDMMNDKSNETVYVVQALSLTTVEFALLGIFDTEARAQAFVDQAPMPQRECLHIHPWRLNQYTENEFWRAGYKPLTEAEFLEATRPPDENGK